MRGLTAVFVAVGFVAVSVGLASANVLNMGGTRNADGSWNGFASLETVPVGNAGNAADMRYSTGGWGGVDHNYRTGKYEVTAGQYCEFLNKVAEVDTHELYNPSMSRIDSGGGITQTGSGTPGDPYRYSVADACTNRPVCFVSFWDACRFANWLQNGQPGGAQDNSTTESGAYILTPQGISSNTVTRNGGWQWAVASDDEWYKAAYHRNNGVTGDYFDYPTSSNTILGRNPNDVAGNNANYYGNPYPIQAPYCTTVVGEFENSASPYGTFDQGGNVYEWTEVVVNGANRGLRGGAFDYPYNYLLAAGRQNFRPDSEVLNLGFRVVQVPEPATLCLMALGGLLIVRRRA